MSRNSIHSNLGLIGDELELRKNIRIDIDDKGRIETITGEKIEKTLDLTIDDRILMIIPGLINSHVHIGDSFAKELGNNMDLIEVVAPPNGLKHQLLRDTSSEIKIKSIKKSITYMISTGTTFFIDFRENGIDGISLIKNALILEPINSLILGRPTVNDNIESILKEADGIGFSSYRSVSKDSKTRLKELKKDYTGKLIACHDAELNKNSELTDNLLDDDLIDIIIHGTQYQIKELIKIKQKSISLVLCPRCNGYFGVGFPPINDIIRLNIPISLGTDNIMANSPDLFEELRYLYRIFRVLDTDDSGDLLTSKELLKMITINAARNFGLENDYGSISVGKYADFFIVDLSSPNFYSKNIELDTFYHLIVQRLISENIKGVYIKGNLVYERK
jgi:cytosine/adenosine deaminase-related metal-dependent hydrolase